MQQHLRLFPLFVALIVGCLSDSSSYKALADNCQPEMVETIPDGMRSATFEGDLRQTHRVLIDMVEKAQSSIKIASMYVSLTDPLRADHPTAQPGKQLLQSIMEAAKRGVRLEVVIDSSQRPMSNLDDLRQLEQVGTLYRLNMTKVLRTGVMHTKFMITDDRTLYVGSSNFDWRSYSHVKEIGVYFQDCVTMASDLDKIFQTYKLMSSADRMPESLPEAQRTSINKQSPFQVTLNDGHLYNMYLAGSPPTVFQSSIASSNSSSGRTDDLEALLSVIDGAQRYVKVSVMNYNVRSAYNYPKHYWPTIDNALRRAAIERKVRVSLLFSDWGNTREEEYIWYRSLNAIQQAQPRDPKSKFAPPLGRFGGIFVKMFKVPAFDDFQKEIPYARVKHDKYVVTERSLYVGTSNWTPEYFESTCGVGFVFESSKPFAANSTIIDDMNKVFDRDFRSEQYSYAV